MFKFLLFLNKMSDPHLFKTGPTGRRVATVNSDHPLSTGPTDRRVATNPTDDHVATTTNPTDDHVATGPTDRCVNYRLCNNTLLESTDRFCGTCGVWKNPVVYGWGELTFIDCKNMEGDDRECSVCFETVDCKIAFPAHCGHSFCIACTKSILIWDYKRYMVSPEQYGCKPCPKNHPSAPFCWCKAYVEYITSEWEILDEIQYNAWCVAQASALMTGVVDPFYGNGICPMCRKKFVSIDSDSS